MMIYEVLVWMFNIRKIVHFSSYNIWCNDSYRICCSFIFFSSICLLWYEEIILKLTKGNFLINFAYLSPILCFSKTFIYVNHFCRYNIFMKIYGDVKEKRGPNSCSDQSFSICHRNLKSISAHSYTKLSILRGYLPTPKFDVVCLYIWDSSWLRCISWWPQSRNSILHFNQNWSYF